MSQQRFTSLDRALLRHAVGYTFDVAAVGVDAGYQSLLRGRLQQLSGLGLASPLDLNRWQLDERMEGTLRGLGDRGDIIRAMHRAMRGQARELVMPGAGRAHAPVVGRIAGKGLADELRDAGYLVVDGVDGRAHYVSLLSKTDLSDYPIGGIVDVRSPSPSAADRNILASARDGIYRTANHLSQVRGRDSVLPSIVRTHVRRLEALRRADIVERMADGAWKIPQNLIEQGQSFDQKQTGGVTVDLRSHLSLAKQAQALGATWLDTQLIGGGKELSASAFGVEVREAMQRRTDFLVREGLAERRDQRVMLARNLLQTLRNRELAQTAIAIQTEPGLTYQPMGQDGNARGVYRRSLQLVSGRYAMLDDGFGFSLVPWRPVIERRLGHTVSASLQTGRVTWEFGRQRGPAL